MIDFSLSTGQLSYIFTNFAATNLSRMEFDAEELKNTLIEKCRNEGILYAMVAIDRRTKEVILPDTLQGALSHPEYFVCTCKRVEDKYIVEEITKT